MRVFAFLLHQREPLVPNAILAAVLQGDSDQKSEFTLTDLLKCCRNMVIFDSHMNMLRFVHTSAQEFLELQPDLDAFRANEVIASSCINMCMYGSPIDSAAGLCQAEHFYQYSVLYWAAHLRDAGLLNTGRESSALLKEFVFDDNELSLSFITWIDAATEFSEALPRHHSLKTALSAVSSSSSTPLFTACIFNLASLLVPLALSDNFDWNQKNNSGHTGLYLACAFGHEYLVETLLTHGANVNVSGGRHGNPLQAACFEGHPAIVQRLLKSGADPELEGKYGNALQASITTGKEDIAILILDHGFKINDKETYKKSLDAAAQGGHIGMVHRLEQAYSSLYGTSTSHRNKAIESAIFKGKLPVLQSLPDSMMPVDCVAIAALGGQNKVVTFLLNKGMDVELQGQFGSPLRSGSIMGHESIVRLLLDRGANVTASSQPFGDALHAAAAQGHIPVTRLLLVEGADPNSSGGFYGCAIQAAAHRGHIDVVKVLVAAGADVYKHGFFKDAFHAAAEGGHEQIVHFLGETGFKYRSPPPPPLLALQKPPSKYKDLLRAASPSRHQSSVDSKLFSTNRFNSDPDALACLLEDKGQLFLTRETKVKKGCHGTSLNNALETAASRGYNGVVKVVLDHRRALGAIALNEEVGPSLYEASCKGYVKIVQLLISSIHEIFPTKRALGRALKGALEGAISHGHITVTKTLREHLMQCKSCTQTLSKHSVGSRSSYPNLLPNAPPEIKRLLTILFEACLTDDVPLLTQILQNLNQFCTPPEVACVQLEALRQTALRGDTDAIQLLVGTISFNHDQLFQVFNLCCNSGLYRSIACLLETWTGPFIKGVELGEGTISASGNGFLEIVRLLIGRLLTGQPMDRQALQDTLDRSLNIASLNGHAGVVSFLLQKGANPNAVVEEPVAVEHPDRPILPFLLSRGSRPKRTSLQAALAAWPSPDSTHPLNITVFSNCWRGADIPGRETTVLLLLEHGADISKLYSTSSSLLRNATVRYTEIVMRAIIDVNAISPRPTVLSSPNHDKPLLPKALEVDEEPSPRHLLMLSSKSSNKSLLELAACRELGAVGIMNVLLETGAEYPDSRSSVIPALKLALSFFRGKRERPQFDPHDGSFLESKSVYDVLKNGPGASVKMLLKLLPQEKTDNGQYDLLLQMAITVRDRDCVELLLSRGIDVNATGYYYGTALQCAARIGDCNLVQTLIRSGADVNAVGGKHGTALRAAVVGAYPDIVDILIGHNAKPNLWVTPLKDDGLPSEPILKLCLTSFNFSIFSSLIAAGADVDVIDIYKTPILTEACKLNNVALVQLLLDHGANINTMKKSPYHFLGETASALHMACAKGHEAIVTFLIYHGANIEPHIEDSQQEDRNASQTPLQMAASSGNASIVRLLIQLGAKINHCNCHGTALSMAAEMNKILVVEELLRYGASIVLPHFNENALAKVCKHHHREIVDLFLIELSKTELENYACVGAMESAADSQDDVAFQLFIERAATVTSSMLTRACVADLPGSVTKLLGLGVDPNSNNGVDCRAIHVAAFHQRLRVLELLIQNGAEVNYETSKYGNPLQAALEGFVVSEIGCPPEIYRRFENNQSLPDSNFVDKLSLDKHIRHMEESSTFGYDSPVSPLASKDLHDCEQALQLLLDCGVEVNPEVRTFGTPLHLASFVGSHLIVQRLLAKGAKINSTCDRFGSVLLAALEGNHIEIAELLLREGVDVNYISSKHGSALHYACSKQGLLVVQMLLRYGADVNVFGGPHSTPLRAIMLRTDRFRPLLDPFDPQSQSENEEILKLLMKHGESATRHT